MIKLNLASGQRPFKNWVNIDIRDQGYPIDVVADIRKLDMYKDNSVDAIVAHHVLEHIRLDDLLATSREWNRVLKPNGKLYVFVPNARELAKAWLENRIDNFTFLVNMYGAYQGHEEDTHKWNYDINELKDRMGGWTGRDFELKWSNFSLLSAIDAKIDPLLQDADLAFDWWILSAVFTK